MTKKYNIYKFRISISIRFFYFTVTYKIDFVKLWKKRHPCYFDELPNNNGYKIQKLSCFQLLTKLKYVAQNYLYASLSNGIFFKLSRLWYIATIPWWTVLQGENRRSKNGESVLSIWCTKSKGKLALNSFTTCIT